MPLCASIPETVDTDTNTRHLYLEDLDKCMKSFNDALTSTMNAYRNLLTSFDQVAQVYGNVAQECGDEVRKPVGEFRDGMRDLKDKGGFEVFNREIFAGTISVMEPVRVDLKKALKSFKNLKSKQKEYDSVRYDLEQTEKSYAKKNKSLSGSSSYKKTRGKRDKAKASFEQSREAFGQEVKALQATTKSVLLQSLNNYLHCTAAFCGQLEATMNGYRTDVDSQGSTTFANNHMDELKEKAEAESMMRRSIRKREASLLYHTESDSRPNVPSAGGDHYQEDLKADAESASRNTDADRAPSMHDGVNGYGNEDAANPLMGVNGHE
ncbi:hypothetical protein JIQ42_04139 [Leishmania sp. Namibia]|uniref:hypothetical protein n=1 Tax=Leishmania sp. Namibia TaxID=2802991 RepID=UPI001B4F5CB2|nr:hypothetical protein JIQ42_04139 [Leishmania sp. Namibia]